MNHADLKDSSFPTGSKVFEQQTLHFPGLKGVQIKSAVDGDFNGSRLIHDFPLLQA
jgi:hypothetical protein